MEGETNPRNLHLIFGIWPLVMANFEMAEYTEDVFELFSCYFPIDFNPSKVGMPDQRMLCFWSGTHATFQNSSHNITSGDLSSRLNACLSHSADFAPFAIPLFMEKLRFFNVLC